MNDTQLDFEFEVSDNKEYEFDGIWDTAIYAKELAGQLLGLYFLILWKGYSKEKNTWEPALAIQYLQRLITAYHKNNPEKPTVTSAPINTALPMVRPTASPMARLTTAPTKKRGQPAGPTATPTKKRGQFARSTTTTKQAKKS